MSGEVADYPCPECSGRLVRDNTPEDRYRCEKCGVIVDELVGDYQDTLREIADEGGPAGALAELVLEGEL